MLMRLARGAGLAGLAAPREWQAFRAGHVHWRPLIGARLTKAELLAALSAGAIPWHEDATNQQPIAVRNIGFVRGWGRVGRKLWVRRYARLWRIRPPPG
ncbi:hypothetical protein EMGBS8_17080 [Verrucomicrobiota bacterium]|nr:hypothetical protein EMGBS8_17080 [Verrucomicrobiota bacterium]